jgi:hypothetical protein
MQRVFTRICSGASPEASSGGTHGYNLGRSDSVLGWITLG